MCGSKCFLERVAAEAALNAWKNPGNYFPDFLWTTDLFRAQNKIFRVF
jgi:hypothetical protein